MSKRIETMLAEEFTCNHCHGHGAHVERLSMSGTGLSRLFEVQPYRYAFVSCKNCGYTITRAPEFTFPEHIEV